MVSAITAPGESTLLVTGVSGALGSLVAERLAGRDDVVLGTRAGLPGTRPLDFDAPETLPEAFAGVETLLPISAGYGEDDVAIARHEAAISAAGAAPFRVPMPASTYAAIAHGFMDGTGAERSDLRALLGGREPLDAPEVFVEAVREG
ncbi:hypothetical protein GCM10010275_12550 [Streptomyces litmocidini]|uniref:hypothetical protein n=1 Tax=Streptomyces litmocidini TaxID=67318 RepID=UPI00167DE58F|nr:hypothetical protein [Streptomyces litmocidini]GGU79183.1 hypothetical protein GCM10010275_12550 [Streptomyces litmocidini]